MKIRVSLDLHVSHPQAVGFDSYAEYVLAEIPVLGVKRKTFYTDGNSQPRFPEFLVNGKQPMPSVQRRHGTQRQMQMAIEISF